MKTWIAGALAGLATVAAVAGNAWAQDTRPVRLMVGAGAGGVAIANG